MSRKQAPLTRRVFLTGMASVAVSVVSGGVAIAAPPKKPAPKSDTYSDNFIDTY